MSEAVAAQKDSAPPIARVALWRNEDWLAVGLGFLLIVIVLAGIRPQLPKFTWNGGQVLISEILSAANLWKAALIGVIYLVLSSIGIALMGKSVIKYVTGFPIIFVLAWLSQL